MFATPSIILSIRALLGLMFSGRRGLNRESYYFHHDRLMDNFNPLAINLMKGGIVYSNAFNTVSPHHAWEAHNSDVGCGLGGTIDRHQDKFSGILNGISYEMWNPETDAHIPEHYSIETFEIQG